MFLGPASSSPLPCAPAAPTPGVHPSASLVSMKHTLTPPSGAPRLERPPPIRRDQGSGRAATTMASFSFLKACSLASSSSLVRTWDAHLMRSNSSGLMMRDSPEGSLAGTLPQGMNSQWGGARRPSAPRCWCSASRPSLITASTPQCHPEGRRDRPLHHGPTREKGSQVRGGPNRDILRAFAKRSSVHVTFSAQPSENLSSIPPAGRKATPLYSNGLGCAPHPQARPMCGTTGSARTQPLPTPLAT